MYKNIQRDTINSKWLHAYEMVYKLHHTPWVFFFFFNLHALVTSKQLNFAFDTHTRENIYINVVSEWERERKRRARSRQKKNKKTRWNDSKESKKLSMYSLLLSFIASHENIYILHHLLVLPRAWMFACMFIFSILVL